jgi:hypothetical protein
MYIFAGIAAPPTPAGGNFACTLKVIANSNALSTTLSFFINPKISPSVSSKSKNSIGKPSKDLSFLKHSLQE